MAELIPKGVLTAGPWAVLTNWETQTASRLAHQLRWGSQTAVCWAGMKVGMKIVLIYLVSLKALFFDKLFKQ